MVAQPCIPMLKALADDTRWRVVQALLKEPQTVTQLADRLGLLQYNVSKHLRILRDAGIVTMRKQGKHVHIAVTASLRTRLARNANVLDLGCCTFRFD